MVVHWDRLAMRRRLTIMILLLLAAITLALWWHSYRQQGWVKWTFSTSSRTYAITLANFPGRLGTFLEWEPIPAPLINTSWGPLLPLSTQPRLQRWSGPVTGSNAYDATLPARPDLYQLMGIAWYRDAFFNAGWSLLVPHRYVAMLLVLPSLIRLWRRFRAGHTRGFAVVTSPASSRVT
jgi:hypothetical protein